MSASALTLLLLFSGCACGRNAETGVSIESYVSALEKVKSNLEADVLPGYTEALERSDLVPELKAARLGVVQDTIDLIDTTLTGEVASTDSAAKASK